MLEYALFLTRDLAYNWPRDPYQYYLCATPPSKNITVINFNSYILYNFLHLEVSRGNILDFAEEYNC
jgi:hypothetical protein